MLKPIATSLTVLTLVLGNGLSPLADAQQMQELPPMQGEGAAPPSRQVPPAYRTHSQSPSTEDQELTATQDAPSASESNGGDWSSGDSTRVKTSDHGIRYVSGGVGEGERAELEALSGQFNLGLLFAMQGSGDYLADVRVRILDPNGTVVLSAESNGPWFFAQLPPDTYTVEVSTPDQSQRQTLRIGPRQSRLNFYWR